MAKNPREPKAVKKLIADAKNRKTEQANSDYKKAINAATLWAKIRRRGQGHS